MALQPGSIGPEGHPHHPHHTGLWTALGVGGLVTSLALTLGIIPRIADGGSSDIPSTGGDTPTSAPAVPGEAESPSPSATAETSPAPNKAIARMEAATLEEFDQQSMSKKMSYFDWLVRSGALTVGEVKTYDINEIQFPDAKSSAIFFNRVLSEARKLHGDGSDPNATNKALKVVATIFPVDPGNSEGPELGGIPYGSYYDPAGVNWNINDAFRAAAANGEPLPEPPPITDVKYEDTYALEGPFVQFGVTLDPEAPTKGGNTEAQFELSIKGIIVDSASYAFVVGWGSLPERYQTSNSGMAEDITFPYPS